MSIKRISLKDATKTKGRTDWGRVAASDGGSEDDFDWDGAEIVDLPRPKQAVSIRLDPDVLEFFRAQGKGYQTRINAVLKTYVAAQRKGG